jgi:hypothetical protein
MLTERQSGFEVVATFWYLHEADIAKSLLESYGLEPLLLDEHQIRMRWHLAAALGGVKLAVPPEQAARARELLAQDHTAHLSDIEEQSLPAHPEELCPSCGSDQVQRTTKKRLPGPFQWLYALLFLVLGLLVPRRRIQIDEACNACGHSWSTTITR